MNPYDTAISIVTATPGTAEDTQCRREAVDHADETQYPWWQQALRTGAGRKVLAELHIPITSEGGLPAEWEARPLAEPNDHCYEAALSVTVLALREAMHARAGVMFLERRGATPGRDGRRHELHLCAIHPEGLRAALMPVC